MVNILLLETATEVCSAALSADGEVIAYAEKSEGFRHSELLTILIGQIFKECGFGADRLDAVCTSRGPGSYTGLRIGVSVAKGLCYALDIPLLAVSTLNVLADHMAKCGKWIGTDAKKDVLLCPMLDARRMEVYTAFYDHRGKQLTDITALIIHENSFADQLNAGPVLFFGNGAMKCKPLLEHQNALFEDQITASARFMSYLAMERYNNNIFENLSYFEPYYLKDFVATVPKNKVF